MVQGFMKRSKRGQQYQQMKDKKSGEILRKILKDPSLAPGSHKSNMSNRKSSQNLLRSHSSNGGTKGGTSTTQRWPRGTYVMDVACGPDYTIAVIHNVYKGRHSLYSWGRGNTPRHGDYDALRAPYTQGRPHPMAFTKVHHKYAKAPTYKNISISTDALVPVHIMNFETKLMSNADYAKTGRKHHSNNIGDYYKKNCILLERLDLEKRKRSRESDQITIGFKSHVLPYSIMPASLDIYNVNHFNTWLSHQEILLRSDWSTMNVSR